VIQLPSNIQDSVLSFSRLPGVGEKTALRQVMAMTKWNPEDINEFARSLNSLNNLKFCTECGMFCEEKLCEVCLREERKNIATICVVENINDLMAIEKSNTFQGLYHIIGGVLNPLAGIGPDQLFINKLVERVKSLNVKSLVLAINPSVEGDATCAYLKQLMPEINIERIGFGIPIGGSLEFLDPLTISKALENRKLL
jgi:recombination protein RecR